MLDEFVPSKPEPKTSLPSGSSKPPIPTSDPTSLGAEGISDDDFAKQLQAGMADLLGGLGSSGDMQAQFEAMMKDLGGAEALAGDIPEESPSATKEKGKTTATSSSAAATEESFQETIKKNMERMRASGDQATAAATEESGDDMLAEMMKAMQASGLDGGEGSEEDLSKMLLGMMEQLTHKEILYEPMKELDDKYPSWLESNSSKVDKDDLKRYKEQQVYVKEIVGRFEKKGYSDDNAADREYIVERMQKVFSFLSFQNIVICTNIYLQMQAAGSPPPDLVGDMAAAQEAFGAPEEGCPTQ